MSAEPTERKMTPTCHPESSSTTGVAGVVVEVVVVMLEALAAARNASASTLVMPTKAICKQIKSRIIRRKMADVKP